MSERPVILLFLLIFSIHLSAQPAFTSAGEVRTGIIVDTTAPFYPLPAIALREDGAAWVVWNREPSRLIRPDLTLDSLKMPSGFAPAFLAGGGFEALVARESCYIPSSPEWLGGNCRYDYRFTEWRNRTVSDSSSVVMTLLKGWYYPCEDSFTDVSDGFFTSEGNKQFFTLNFVTGDFYPLGWYYRSSFCAFDRVSHRVTVLRSQSERYNGHTTWNDPRDLQLPQHYTISPPRDGVLLYMKKWKRSPDDISFHRRSIQFFNTNGDSLTPLYLVDSIDTKRIDYTDRLFIGGDADFFIIRRLLPSDSVIAEHRSLTGSRLSENKLLFDSVHTSQRWYFHTCSGSVEYEQYETNRRADCDIRQLPDGRYVAVWAKKERNGGNNVYTALFSAKLDRIGQSKRVNSDTTISAFRPILAINGNTVHVAWLEHRSVFSQFEVSYRRFRADEILSTDTPRPPASLAITSIYPQPAHDRVTIAYTMPNNISSAIEEKELLLVDAFGRIVRRTRLTRETSTNGLVELSVSGLPSGIYFTSISGDLFHGNIKVILIR